MNDMSPRKVPISPRVTISPKLSTNSDEVKTSDTSSIMGMQILQKRITLERNESGLSFDGSIVSEIEGESEIDRLKRQVEHDKKVLSSLYKELEEEKNASTIAVNQAMAMITRIQEEKATLHMESLQCLRMMEEQAEYDMEALQKTNDLLTEKEKEVQDLEEELEFYRSKFSNEVIFGTPFSDRKATGDKENDSREQNSEVGVEQNGGAEEKSSSSHQELDLDSLINEVSDLSQKLEALEADQNFLEHSINSIRYGEEGLQFIQEIASHLKRIAKDRDTTKRANHCIRLLYTLDSPESKVKVAGKGDEDWQSSVQSHKLVFSVDKKFIGLNVRLVSFPIIPWFAVITGY
ncbi:hypothetical protein OIU78_022637 [Salix suchowensis]|nr:hypothetical protein OIU78_022637 [Salix suchowensis]